MQANWRLELPQWVVLVGMFLAGIVAWPFVPDRIPVHWNLQGEVDRMGGRLEGLLLLPLVALGVYALLRFLPRIDPCHENYSSFTTAYATIRLSVLLLLAAVNACMIVAAFGVPNAAAIVVPLSVGLLFMVLGNLMGKIRPNWFVGVRTPWTLSSQRSWNQTHRLAGWLFELMGIVIAACGFWPSPMTFGAAIAINVACIIWLIVFSYLVWKDDPDRILPTGVSPAIDEKPMP